MYLLVCVVLEISIEAPPGGGGGGGGESNVTRLNLKTSCRCL